MTRTQIACIVVATALGGAWTPAQTRMFTTGTPEELDRARALARPHLGEMARALGIDADDLTITSAQIDQLSMAHVRVRQSFRGVPVIGGEAIVHLRSTGEVSGDTNSLVPGIKVDTTPKVTMSDAIARAVSASGCVQCATPPTAELAILRREGTDYLVYQVQLRGLDQGSRPTMPMVYVNAHDGQVVHLYENLQTGQPSRAK